MKTKPRPVRDEVRELSAGIHAVIDPGRSNETAADCAEYWLAYWMCQAKMPVWACASREGPRMPPNIECPNVCPCFRRRTP
jgi:hypothetical protein